MSHISFNNINQSAEEYQPGEKPNSKKQHIKDILPSLSSYNTKSYALFQEILISAKPSVSCTGTHKVTFKHYKGSVSLDRLEKNMVSLIDSNPKFNESERASGEAIYEILSEHRNECSKIVKAKHCLKKTIYKIVQFFLKLFTSKNLYNSKDYFRYFCFSVPPSVTKEFPNISLKDAYQIYENVVLKVRCRTKKNSDDGKLIFADESKCIQFVAKKYNKILKEKPNRSMQLILFDLRFWVYQELLDKNLPEIDL